MSSGLLATVVGLTSVWALVVFAAVWRRSKMTSALLSRLDASLDRKEAALASLDTQVTKLNAKVGEAIELLDRNRGGPSPAVMAVEEARQGTAPTPEPQVRESMVGQAYAYEQRAAQLSFPWSDLLAEMGWRNRPQPTWGRFAYYLIDYDAQAPRFSVSLKHMPFRPGGIVFLGGRSETDKWRYVNDLISTAHFDASMSETVFRIWHDRSLVERNLAPNIRWIGGKLPRSRPIGRLPDIQVKAASFG